MTAEPTCILLEEGKPPTLDTVLMVEKAVEQNSGEHNRTELWKTLPRQVMWQTYLVILEYLESINKIAFDSKGNVAYIWNPKLAKKLRTRRRYHCENLPHNIELFAI